MRVIARPAEYLALLALAGFSGCSVNPSGNGGGYIPPIDGLPTAAIPTFPKTTIVPTERPPPLKTCNGRKMGTYAWNQAYWRNGDSLLSDFLDSDVGREWNCGDVYINIADVTNYDKIKDPEKLVAWMKDFRRLTGNIERLWLTYGDVVSKDGKKMVQFVETFKYFLMRHVDANTMAEISPIGLSFDVEHVDQNDVKDALVAAQQMKVDLANGMGYLPNSLFVQYTIEGAPDALQTEHVMRYADSALMMLYRNEIKDESGNDSDDLLGRMRWMMTEQCAACTQPGWEQLKAKITVMVEGACALGAHCGKISVCAFDATGYPDANGGVQYTWDMLQKMDQLMVPLGIVTQAQYDHLFDHSKTLFAIHNWEWAKCFYGDAFSQAMGYTDKCPNYHSMAAGCRTQ